MVIVTLNGHHWGTQRTHPEDRQTYPCPIDTATHESSRSAHLCDQEPTRAPRPPQAAPSLG